MLLGDAGSLVSYPGTFVSSVQCFHGNFIIVFSNKVFHVMCLLCTWFKELNIISLHLLLRKCFSENIRQCSTLYKCFSPRTMYMFLLWRDSQFSKIQKSKIKRSPFYSQCILLMTFFWFQVPDFYFHSFCAKVNAHVSISNIVRMWSWYFYQFFKLWTQRLFPNEWSVKLVKGT